MASAPAVVEQQVVSIIILCCIHQSRVRKERSTRESEKEGERRERERDQERERERDTKREERESKREERETTIERREREEGEEECERTSAKFALEHVDLVEEVVETQQLGRERGCSRCHHCKMRQLVKAKRRRRRRYSERTR